jgi:hypothetical protein
MNKQEWDNSLLEHFAPKEGELSLDLIMEMVAEMMDTPIDLRTPIVEAEDTKLTSGDSCEIPEPPLTELGWNKLETAEGALVAGPQRELLEGYLKNIAPGGDLTTKIAALDSFYENGFDQMEKDSGTSQETISKILSFLVFYKTLTRIITNFNASSAGFTFEAFLATLLGGSQIKANTGTIADFKTADNIPISLKLYTETNLAVGGSFRDLVRDLASPKFGHPKGNAMRYVVCTKNLSKPEDGDPMKQTGGIKFYEFDFTLDNVANIIARASKNHTISNFILPLTKDAAGNDVLVTNVEDLQEPAEISNEDISARLKDVAGNVDFWKELGLQDYQIDNLLNSGIISFREDASLDTSKTSGTFLQQGTAAAVNKEKLIPLLVDTEAEGGPQVPGGDKTVTGVIKALNSVLKAVYAELSATNKLRGTGVSDLLDQGIFGSRKIPSNKKIDKKASQDMRAVAERSRVWYNAQDTEGKIRALKFTRGYLKPLKGEGQFDLNRNEATDPSAAIWADVVESPTLLGEIKIGAPAISNVLAQTRGILDENICSIFSSLKELSSQLNHYFASGLPDDGSAGKAITAADSIGKKTEKIVSTQDDKK